MKMISKAIAEGIRIAAPELLAAVRTVVDEALVAQEVRAAEESAAKDRASRERWRERRDREEVERALRAVRAGRRVSLPEGHPSWPAVREAIKKAGEWAPADFEVIPEAIAQELADGIEFEKRLRRGREDD